jgi:hypothetical protein
MIRAAHSWADLVVLGVLDPVRPFAMVVTVLLARATRIS